MISHKRDQISDRINDAADAVKDAWSGARERGADVVDAARDKMDSARSRVGDAQDALADQLESAADAIRRNRGRGAVSRMAHDRPLSTVMLAFAAGAVAAVIAGVVMNSMKED